MAMVLVNDGLFKGQVKRVNLGSNSDKELKQLQRELETRPNGKNALVVKTATGDVVVLEQDRRQQLKQNSIFKTGDKVSVDGRDAKVLFREVERPKFGETFFGVGKWGAALVLPLGLLVGLVTAGDRAFGGWKTGLAYLVGLPALFGMFSGAVGSLSTLGAYRDRK